MTPKQREAFDLLTLQLVEQGYMRIDNPTIPAIHDFERATASGSHRPGVWCPTSSSIGITNDREQGRKRWDIRVFWLTCEEVDPYWDEDCLGYTACAYTADGNIRCWLRNHELLIWRDLGEAVQSAEDLAAWIDDLPLEVACPPGAQSQI